jgi:lipopolysaccharide/colanic/teichoic acid biosynthesis glycosyltransferase
VDELIIYQSGNLQDADWILDRCEVMGLTAHLCLDFEMDRQTQKIIEKYCGYYVLTESPRIATQRQMMMKRLMDIVGGLVGLLLTAILTILVGPLIFVSDPGPIFYSQVRKGKNGRDFRMYKFRSMYKDADARKAELMAKNEMQGLMFKMENDPRILGSGPDGTKKGIGWFIRKTSIDEFPQFWNVLKGDMSLVGTRPPTLDEWSRYELHHRARLSIRPGITGLWQVSGRSDITDFEDVVKLDLEYINNWTVAGDLKILLRTVAAVFRGSGAK